MAFEKKLADLEAIVERLEAGDRPLEESLALFERGIGLVRELTKQLDDVELRLEILLRDAETGDLEVRETEDPGRDD